jgi:hypothetical protein
MVKTKMMVASFARSLFVTGRQGISSLRAHYPSKLDEILSVCETSFISFLNIERHYEAFSLKHKNKVSILSVVPGGHHQSAKIIFDDSPSTTVNFKYIWVRGYFHL